MPLLERHTEADGTLWGIWRMTELAADQLKPWVTDNQIVQAEQLFHHLPRQMEWLSVRALLAELLEGKCPLIGYLDTGKPFLTDDSRHISISHTRGYAMVAVSQQEIGIDIEHYRDQVRRVSDRFVRDDEIVHIYNGSDLHGLTLLWSAKEALYKCLGQEGVDFKQHLQLFPPQRLASAGHFQAVEHFTNVSHQFRISYSLREDVVMTFASFL